MPGVGLLVIRLVAGTGLIANGIMILRPGPAIGPGIISVLEVTCGILLLAGLLTPIAGVLLAGVELWSVISQPGDPWLHILLGTLGAALAMVGPGAWSIDARLFGWKRIEVGDRKR